MEKIQELLIDFERPQHVTFIKSNLEIKLMLNVDENYDIASLYLLKPSGNAYLHHTLSNEFNLDCTHAFNELGCYKSIIALYKDVGEERNLVKVTQLNIDITNLLLKTYSSYENNLINNTPHDLLKTIALYSVTSGAFETSKYGGIRGLKFSWWQNSQNISGNYTDIGWNFVGSGSNPSTWYYTLNGYLNINGARVFTQDSSKVQLGVGTVLANGTTRIYHNADGKKSFGADGGAGIYSYGAYQTGSGSWQLPTIPRQANIINASDFNDEQNPTITFNNVGGFRINARLEFNDVSINRNNIPNTGKYVFSLTDDERKLLRKKCTGNSMTVRIVIATCISGTTENYWSVQDKKMTIVDANPVFNKNQITYKDNNDDVVSITENNQQIVRNLSDLLISFTGAEPQKESTITKYELTFNGNTQDVSVGDVDLGIINLTSDSDLIIKAIDSRGNATSVSKTITILDWELPIAQITAKRVNNYEDDTKLRVQVSVSSVNQKNSIQSIYYRYKKASETNYSQNISIENDEITTIVIDKLFAWDFQVEINDKFGKKIYNFQVAKGMPILFIDVEKLSVGVNTFPAKSNSLELGGELFLQSGNQVLDYDVIDNF